MRQLVKGSTALAAVSLSEMAMRFVRTKFIALALGPVGTGFLAQLGIFFELLRVWGDLGSRRGVIKQIAELRQAGGRENVRYGQIVQTSYFLALAASGLTGLIVTLFSRPISQSLYGSPDYYLYIIFLAALLPIASLSTVTASIIKGNLEYMAFAKYTFTAYLAVMIVTPLFVYLWRDWGAILVQALFFIFPLIAYLLFNVRMRFLIFSRTIDWRALKEQFSFGFVQVYQESLAQIVKVFIAAWIVKKLGLSLMGIYQVVTTFSTIYLAIPIQIMSGYSLPLIASATNSKDIIRGVNDSLRFLIFILTPVIVAVMIWPELFIYCFFSKEFLSAVLPLEIQLLGTFFMVVAFPFAVTLQARGHLKALMVVATATPLFYLFFSWFFFDVGALIGVAIAYCATGLVNLLIQYYFTHRYHGMHLMPKNKRLLLYTSAWILLAFLCGVFANFWIFRILITFLAFPWFYWSSKNHEREFLVKKIRVFRDRAGKLISENQLFAPRRQA